MYAKVNRSFRDLKEGVDRKEGDVFELTAERFADINRKLNAYVTECDAPKPKTKRRTTANKAKEPDNK